MLTDCGADQAMEVLERMRVAMPGGQTCSIGVAELGAEEGFAETLARADAMLYEAKRAGRDQIAAVAGLSPLGHEAAQDSGLALVDDAEVGGADHGPGPHPALVEACRGERREAPAGAGGR